MLLPEAAVVRVRSRLPSPAASTSAHVWAPSSLFTHLSCPCYLEVLHVVRSRRPPSGIQYAHQILCADCSSGIERIARGMPRANDAGLMRDSSEAPEFGMLPMRHMRAPSQRSRPWSVVR